MMHNILKSIGELLITWVTGISFLLDFIYVISRYFFTLEYNIHEDRIVLWVLITGFVISAIQKITEKNKIINVYKLSIPEIALYIRKGDRNNNILVIKNLSNSPIKDISFSQIHTGGIFIYSFILEGTNILKNDEERAIVVKTNNNLENEAPLALFDQKYANADFELNTDFRSFDNLKFRATFIIGKSGIILKKSIRDKHHLGLRKKCFGKG